MKILVTGAHGFVGKNLTAALHALINGTDRCHPELSIAARLTSYSILRV